ncbi:hypothetical protein [Piscirickettsia litoralis]|uniref:Uncharacterized protein n=1 Tax=Piscirickettsia litoralis TaxID=1891921 RepID=A0ABX3A4M8_9GAMM|nr:hypothetical protein [Piscirickettsia litoralis]ODN43455.1 hypothetical protein BGC07_11660 [Piscirickettsia litoralis]
MPDSNSPLFSQQFSDLKKGMRNFAKKKDKRACKLEAFDHCETVQELCFAASVHRNHGASGATSSAKELKRLLNSKKFYWIKNTKFLGKDVRISDIRSVALRDKPSECEKEIWQLRGQDKIDEKHFRRSEDIEKDEDVMNLFYDFKDLKKHGIKYTGDEPSLSEPGDERVDPLVSRAVGQGDEPRRRLSDSEPVSLSYRSLFAPLGHEGQHRTDSMDSYLGPLPEESQSVRDPDLLFFGAQDPEGHLDPEGGYEI